MDDMERHGMERYIPPVFPSFLNEEREETSIKSYAIPPNLEGQKMEGLSGMGGTA